MLQKTHEEVPPQLRLFEFVVVLFKKLSQHKPGELGEKMMHRKFQVALLLVLCLIVAAGAFAQTSTSGSIEGKVTDKAGTPLPGVTLEIKSPNLQGTKIAVSDATG